MVMRFMQWKMPRRPPELELKIIQTQMAQKPMLREEVYEHDPEDPHNVFSDRPHGPAAGPLGVASQNFEEVRYVRIFARGRRLTHTAVSSMPVLLSRQPHPTHTIPRHLFEYPALLVYLAGRNPKSGHLPGTPHLPGTCGGCLPDTSLHAAPAWYFFHWHPAVAPP
jgi:hypothetical protein